MGIIGCRIEGTAGAEAREGAGATEATIEVVVAVAIEAEVATNGTIATTILATICME